MRLSASYSQKDLLGNVPPTPPTFPMITSSTAPTTYNTFNANGSTNKETVRALEGILKIVDPMKAPRFQGCLPRRSTGPLNNSKESVLFMDAVTPAIQTRGPWGFPATGQALTLSAQCLAVTASQLQELNCFDN